MPSYWVLEGICAVGCVVGGEPSGLLSPLGSPPPFWLGVEFIEQGHFRTICTRVQFAAGPGRGARCPKGAVYGQVKAWSPLLDESLRGAVYLRSSNHKLPDLVLVLHGQIDIELAGRIDSVKGGIRTTFEAVPDAPVSKVVVDMQGGKKGLIVNSTNICRGKHRADVKLVGQNGKRRHLRPVVRASCGKKHKKKHKGYRRHHKRG